MRIDSLSMNGFQFGCVCCLDGWMDGWMDGCCKDVMIDDVFLPTTTTTTVVQAKMNEMCWGIILFLCASQNHFYVQFWARGCTCSIIKSRRTKKKKKKKKKKRKR